jgi:hypothetical protein
VTMFDFSTFSQIVDQSNVEQYQGLIHPQAPDVPFAFVSAAALDKRISGYLYIVPPEVIERKEVKAWRFKYKEWQRKPSLGPYWFYVTRAEPLE